MKTTPVSDPTALKIFMDYFYHWEKTQPEKIFLRQPFGHRFNDFTWKETGNQVRRLASYLLSLNLAPKSPIGLVSKNCAEWIIADLAIMMAGQVSVPFYPTLTGPQLHQVLSHSGCVVLFVGKLDDWPGMKTGVPADVSCISFPNYNPDPEHIQWKDILASRQPLKESPLPELNDLFSIIYTSGTTGNPKGVMLTYQAVASAMAATKDILRFDLPETRFFSYLPLCHIAERNIVEATCIGTGGTIYFAESLDTFAQNLAQARPTHFLAVPRIWTKFQLGILAKMPQRKLDLLLKIPFISGMVRKKIREGLGLNEAELILTGAAPMPASLIVWFRRLGIKIQEAYGMTENLGAVCMTPRNKPKDGTVGKIYPGVEVKILPDTGEILTRSDWTMKGYYKEPKMTAETIDEEGWIHTGDVGELDSEGYLKITGRVKEMYKTSKGEYVAPAQIEFGFADNKLIDQICVVGQRLPQPIALVVLSEMARRVEREAVAQSLEATLTDLNPKLKSYERVRKIVVMRDAWTVDNNMLTPTLKTRRNVIEKNYDQMIEPWYEGKGNVIWE
ncbi:AMP-binding protein [Runella slithyformis]|uniref:Long-chain-fatty-acid--CoA ligase n=1 Tax=Runella slithyformis (strain ATCC 29530 / DSM 19594 / LMG 11500 / NCIMB 11436 / LSU 4) TaxID=761193 RepID=A0A7U3ZJF2_RUNSL|nr:AMP-binding protein [Runella slithyformis]AEI48347.1 Long-chain-fatty-acid--CoA ligase [Runella slithyformis DSM 19594]